MKIREMLDQLDEISRRDFLKGVGATAGLVAIGAPKQAFGQEVSPSLNIPFLDISELKVAFAPDPNPYYPSFSKRAGEQGEVVIRLFIDIEGKVDLVKLLKSCGFPRLDRMAMEIGKRYVFQPVMSGGKPISVTTNMLIKLRLDPTPPQNVDQYPNMSQTKNSQVSVAEEAASPDAVNRIEELVKYK